MPYSNVPYDQVSLEAGLNAGFKLGIAVSVAAASLLTLSYIGIQELRKKREIPSE